MIGAALANHLYLPTAASCIPTCMNIWPAFALAAWPRPQRHSAWLAQKDRRQPLRGSRPFLSDPRATSSPPIAISAHCLRRPQEKPCYLMQRGVDTHLFSPGKARRARRSGLVLGFVGVLSIEKNVGLGLFKFSAAPSEGHP